VHHRNIYFFLIFKSDPNQVIITQKISLIKTKGIITTKDEVPLPPGINPFAVNNNSNNNK
jgi:hypothetical protein